MDEGGPLPLLDDATVVFPARIGDVKLRCELVLEPRFTCHDLIVSEVSDRVFHIERQHSCEDGTHGEEKTRERVFPVEQPPFHVTGLEIFPASATLALHGEWSITTKRVQGDGNAVYLASVSAGDQSRTYAFKSSTDVYTFQHTLRGHQLLAEGTDVKFAYGNRAIENGSLSYGNGDIGKIWRWEYENTSFSFLGVKLKTCTSRNVLYENRRQQ
jgi:hypothetical protein